MASNTNRPRPSKRDGKVPRPAEPRAPLVEQNTFAKMTDLRISRVENIRAREINQTKYNFYPARFTVKAFTVFALAHTIAAVYSPIQDCDEVYNYWEPTHYLTHGYGFETWEYSPDFALRSWAYALLHAAFVSIARLVPVIGTKVFQFYFTRTVLGLFCAAAEARLFRKLYQLMSPRIAYFFMLIMITSPGMFHASVAYLPSSFAMYCVMMSMSDWLDWRGGLRTGQGIFWIGLGSTWGWPFTALMVVPFIFEEVLLGSLADEFLEVLTRFMHGIVRTVIACFILFNIDLFFYHIISFVPWNLIQYNVLAARAGKGPNIYGTEPWHFYTRNLLLNFNLWFILAVAAMPLLYIQEFVRQRPATKQTYIRNFVFVAPFYLWLAIFTLQPHKEERFMYPAYPALALNAAIAIHIILTYLGQPKQSGLVRLIPVQIRLAAVGLLFVTATALSLLRTMGLVTAYDAPLKIYQPLHEPGVARSGDFLCLGKEWYRFPSSYHLPQGVKAKFVKSEFSGLLPGEFSEANTGFGLFPGTWLTPGGMNDENREDVGKYTDLASCKFMVDSSVPSQPPTSLEPDRVHDLEKWERVQCEPFLDAAATGIVGRLFWVPEWDVVPDKYRRRWGEYCLLKSKSRRN